MTVSWIWWSIPIKLTLVHDLHVLVFDLAGTIAIVNLLHNVHVWIADKVADFGTRRNKNARCSDILGRLWWNHRLLVVCGAWRRIWIHVAVVALLRSVGLLAHILRLVILARHTLQLVNVRFQIGRLLVVRANGTVITVLIASRRHLRFVGWFLSRQVLRRCHLLLNYCLFIVSHGTRKLRVFALVAWVGTNIALTLLPLFHNGFWFVLKIYIVVEIYIRN